jgi:c(7)-type cytochrome triheme protein
MSGFRIGAVVVLVALAVGMGVVGPSEAQKAPGPLTFDKGKDSPGTVTFEHEKHKAAGVEKCTACHVKIFKMKKGQTGPLSMEKMKAGEQCGACHNGKELGGKVVFASDDKSTCEKCHKK